jgi:hypothetical protein
MAEEPFFVGWQDAPPQLSRRQVLGVGAGIVVGAGALGLGLGAASPSPGPGVWDQGKKVAVTGTIYPEPYLHLLTEDLGYGLRPVFLVGQGKDRIHVRPALTFTGAAVTGTLIERGEHAMMAVEGVYPDPAPGPCPGGAGEGPWRGGADGRDSRCEMLVRRDAARAWQDAQGLRGAVRAGRVAAGLCGDRALRQREGGAAVP